MSKSRFTGRIRIKSLPHGEAPKWVRKEWVGLTLACLPRLIYGEETQGVLSKKFKPNATFVADVSQGDAIARLARKSPKAAEWFRKQGFPKRNQGFLFREEEIDIIRGVRRQKLIVADDMETGTMELPGR